MRKLVPYIGAAIATVVLLGGAGSLLTGGLRLQIPNSSTSGVATTTSGTPGHDPAKDKQYQPLSIVPPSDGSKLALSAAPAAKVEQGYLVSVKVTSPAGKPVGDAPIRFYDVVDLFGQREELIGSATTDGQGVAVISYLPASAGTHQIVARFPGQGSLVESVGSMSLDATVAAPTYKSDPPGFALFTRYVPYGAGVVVLAVWGLIAFSLFATARGIAAAADGKIRKGETA